VRKRPDGDYDARIIALPDMSSVIVRHRIKYWRVVAGPKFPIVSEMRVDGILQMANRDHAVNLSGPIPALERRIIRQVLRAKSQWNGTTTNAAGHREKNGQPGDAIHVG
jgi:hypothetical protein